MSHPTAWELYTRVMAMAEHLEKVAASEIRQAGSDPATCVVIHADALHLVVRDARLLRDVAELLGTLPADYRLPAGYRQQLADEAAAAALDDEVPE